MLLHVKGKPLNISSPIVGRVVFNPNLLDNQSILTVKDSSPVSDLLEKPLGLISTLPDPYPLNNIPQIYSLASLGHLEEGDIISIDNLGSVRTLYRINSIHNSILVTEKCNSKCLMCSQPPKKRDDIEYLFQINKKLISLIPKDCEELVITGGEPTLLGDKFFELLKLMVGNLPNTEIHILTNGRKFAQIEFTAKLKDIYSDRIVFGIPLYSDFYGLHDYIVQSKYAFYQTMLGLHNLARLKQKVEMRIVLHKLTVERLEKLSRYIYKNIPFVEHIAFMGLENTGFTPYNLDILWIDAYDYMEELKNSVLYLDSFGMNVSIYNLQLCILPLELWCFARKSISEWKNNFLKKCKGCSVKNQCGGFFQSNIEKHSMHINPIKSD